MVLWSVLVALIFLAYNLLRMTGLDLPGLLSVFPYYILFGAAVFSALMGTTAYQTYLPVYLSLGSTRRDAMAGIHLMQLVLTVGCTVLAALLCLLVPGDPAHDLLPLLPAAFFGLLLLAKFGSLLGCGLLTLPRAGKVLCVILVSLFSGAAGFCAFTLVDTLTEQATLSLPTGMTLALAAVLVILLAIEIPWQRRILLRYEVKL